MYIKKKVAQRLSSDYNTEVAISVSLYQGGHWFNLPRVVGLIIELGC